MKSVFGLIPIILGGCFLITGNRNPSADAIQSDGPYVFYNNKQIVVKYVVDDDGVHKIRTETMDASAKDSLVLKVLTDLPGTTFSFKLKSSLENEIPSWDSVSKMLIISDIEGNFESFRKLLQGNGVVDSLMNWSFGNAHLVLTGDFFDRGNQQTEVLWLIYSLEEKAKAAGGYVHFVLGNHEIMNLSGDIRYVNKKYLMNAALMNKDYITLFAEDTELGRWLRTKNVMERVGDILFVHGGISEAVNHMSIQPEALNSLVRPYYPDSTYSYNDSRIDTLFSDLGPFWYRGYYSGSPKASLQQIERTLALYNVKHIATGHTVIADTISVLFSGKVFNTDVHHAKGMSEGLLKENGQYFRVNQLGEKFRLPTY